MANWAPLSLLFFRPLLPTKQQCDYEFYIHYAEVMNMYLDQKSAMKWVWMPSAVEQYNRMLFGRANYWGFTLQLKFCCREIWYLWCFKCLLLRFVEQIDLGIDIEFSYHWYCGNLNRMKPMKRMHLFLLMLEG